MKENNTENKIGEINIADEVVACIAGLAATDVKGVRSLANGITHDMITKSGVKNLSKAVRLEITDAVVSGNIMLILDGTVSIPTVSAGVQEKVKDAISSMTGMEVRDLDITIAGVNV